MIGPRAVFLAGAFVFIAAFVALVFNLTPGPVVKSDEIAIGCLFAALFCFCATMTIRGD
jgi:hypothetical protein